MISTLLNYSEYIFWFIFVFTIIVFIHEFGHYIVARINNVDIEKFSIGFGPVLFSKIDNKECEVNLPNGYSLTTDDKEKLYKINGVSVI